jgi:hypothetical protein
MSFAKDLLFLHGHITDPHSLDTPRAAAGHASSEMMAPTAVSPDTLSRSRAATTAPPPRATAASTARDRLAPALRRLGAPARYFNGLLPLATLPPLASRAGSAQSVFGPTYGNRVASHRVFGGSSPWPGAAGCLTGACG